MKLLLDQNLSYRILKKILQSFPESQQVKRLGLMNESDTVIWEFAKAHDYTILTHDSDFNEFSLINGYPPKIIWLRTGNITNDKIIELIF
jgi:predicted nuclease of predicted toxin-antitoxin system